MNAIELSKEDEMDFGFGCRRATEDEAAAQLRALMRMKQLFPALPKRDWVEFLISNTAYPFNSLCDAIEQAARLSKRAHKDVTRAYIISDRDMSAGMRFMRRKYPEHFKD